MLDLDFHPTGRHFLQIPGPSPVPERILRAMSLPTIDHRGPEFGALGLQVLAGLREVFKTRHPVVVYPASGTGAWEAALVNTLSPGDQVMLFPNPIGTGARVTAGSSCCTLRSLRLCRRLPPTVKVPQL